MESINEIKQLSSDLLASNSEIEKSIEFLSCKYDEICGEIKNVHSQNMIYGDRLSKLENTTEEIERFSRSSSIEIRNLPINLPLSQDDQVVIACRIFSELSTKVQTSDIYDIRCLPSKQDTKTVLVTLNSVILKNQILKAFKEYNKKNSGGKLNAKVLAPEYPGQLIYVSENLTARTRRLFYLAREFAKAENFKHCWTANCRVLLRKEDNGKLIVLTSESQLSNLKSKN
ncbi:unnamed protein product [Parnassius apollo]|uniref:(apollo) hypothetical protein n=1 Tax=Parnassius apollo TaxID=110799 RepID=A0A8S3XDG1_PARAO|nr:unnamed protein product [Parnassius apollo]